MGRRPEPDIRRMRPEWVYVGAIEAAALGGVSSHTIEKWIASGELVKYHLDGARSGGRPRNLYRLDDVLALVATMRR